MLEVRDLNAWYGRSHILQGVSLTVGAGEAVCVIGRNGAGKTTTLRAIMGLVPRRTGKVRFDGRDILAEPTHRRFAYGLAYVPEERRIVPGITVQENLRLGLVASPNRAARARSSTASPRPSRASRSASRKPPTRCRGASSRCWRSPAP